MRKFFVAAVLPVVGSLMLLQGCNKPSECHGGAAFPHDDVSSAEKGVESYSCSPDGAGILEQTWCAAKDEYAHNGKTVDSQGFPSFLQGYREGVAASSIAEDSRLSLIDEVAPSEGEVDQGYRQGYLATVRAMGLVEYNCGSSDMASEYKDRWCEAAQSYRSSEVGSENNPFVKGRFVDGYMTGGRVALTVPSSMDVFFGGEEPDGRLPAVSQPVGDLKGADLAFYRGFDAGYQAMIDSIRESINQVMQQMQVPNDLEFPEGFMPPSE